MLVVFTLDEFTLPPMSEGVVNLPQPREVVTSGVPNKAAEMDELVLGIAGLDLEGFASVWPTPAAATILSFTPL